MYFLLVNIFVKNINKNFLFQEQGEGKDKILLRRERNRVAATKCRNKKKEKLNMILGKAEAIEKSNNKLRQEMYRLEGEKKQLVTLLVMKSKGYNHERVDKNPESSKYNSTSEQLDEYSLIETLTNSTKISDTSI